MRVVITQDLPGSPWDTWDDARHGPVEAPEGYNLHRCTETAFLSWEALIGRR